MSYYSNHVDAAMAYDEANEDDGYRPCGGDPTTCLCDDCQDFQAEAKRRELEQWDAMHDDPTYWAWLDAEYTRFAAENNGEAA